MSETLEEFARRFFTVTDNPLMYWEHRWAQELLLHLETSPTKQRAVERAALILGETR